MAKRRPCIECGKLTTARDFVTGTAVCQTCRQKVSKYKCVTVTRAKTEYGLKNADLSDLPCLEQKNPHYACASPMRLYRLEQVKQLAKRMRDA